MALREFSGAAKRTTLTADITAASTAITCSDLTGYPTGVTAPFVVTFDLGLAGEEKVLTTRSGNTLNVVERGYDGTNAAAHAVGGTVDHTIDATTIREMNAFANGGGLTTAAADALFLTPAEADAVYATSGHSHASAPVTKTIRISHTFTISGEVKVASGDDFYIPPFWLDMPAGQTGALVAARHVTRSGTSVAATVQVNGVDAPGFTAVSVTPTEATADPANVPLASGLNKISLTVASPTGTPKNMSFTVFFDVSV